MWLVEANCDVEYKHPEVQAGNVFVTLKADSC